MTEGGHKKFLFDNDFGQNEEARPPAKSASDANKAEPDKAESAEDGALKAETEEELPPPPTFSQEDLDRAREEGRQQGRDEATRDMAGAMEQRIANTLEAIDTRMADLFEAYAQDMEQHSRDAIAIATVIMRKLFPALNMEHAMAEIEHMITEAMKRTSGSPALIVRVPAEIQREVEEKANQLAKIRGREGTVTVMADADLAPGDVAVEWDGGGMLRDSSFIWREIDEIIERNLGKMPQMEEQASKEDLSNAPVKQEVVKPAPVGENEENPAESPQPASDAPAGDEPED